MGALYVPMVIDYYALSMRVVIGWLKWGNLTKYGAQHGWIYANLFRN